MKQRELSIRAYLLVFIALMVLLGITVGAAYVPRERWGLPSIAVSFALLVAGIKAYLVVLYFMHVRVSSRLTRVFVCAGVVWLGILFALTLSEYLSRSWLPVSRGWIEVEARGE